jgi:hypothetical protein
MHRQPFKRATTHASRSPLAPLASIALPVAVLESLLLRALCRGDTDDAERASIELYLRGARARRGSRRGPARR